MKIKSLLLTVSVNIAVSLLVTSLYYRYISKNDTSHVAQSDTIPSAYVGFTPPQPPLGDDENSFITVASNTLPAVVQVKATARRQLNQFDLSPFGMLDESPKSSMILSGGSGVIIKDDGYIVTNEHVISDAVEVMVTLSNKKSYKASVVGTDENSDIALLKIDGEDLPYLSFGNSDELKPGQWVMAAGYPLNLDATVTAGIVSGKARRIGINKGDYPIESFIQTDAVINIGNSGGALVNTDGELVGITSSLVSPTGSYVGYSYAIPSNIVKKVANELIKFGKIKRT
jgi:S1-C subfamily serine protease